MRRKEWIRTYVENHYDEIVARDRKLKKLGIEGDYEGIGHCALGYAAVPANAAAPRKDNYVYYVD